MSETKGLFGFRYNGIYYLTYNHLDSFPGWLGRNLVQEISNANLPEWKRKFLKLKIISEMTEPEPEDISALTSYTNLSVGSGLLSDWYCLLRGTQGSIERMLDSGYFLPYLIGPQLQINWDISYTYIVNIDRETFVWYAGLDRQVEIPLVYLQGCVEDKCYPLALSFAQGELRSECKTPSYSSALRASSYKSMLYSFQN